VNVERLAAVEQPARRPATWRRYWYPLSALVRRDLRKRYAASLLGAAWMVLQPLILLALYLLVFAVILRSGRDPAGAREFALYLLAGMLPYLAITDALHRAIWSLREDRSLLERETFPAEVLPLSRVVTASLPEVVGLALLIVLAASMGRPPSAWLIVMPVLLAGRIALTAGLAWILSTLAVFVTDLAELLSLLLTAWLFLTPIFYPAAAAPPLLRTLLVVNPLYYLVRAYRFVLIDGQNPGGDALALLLAATVCAAAGLWFFHRTIDRSKDLL
jgi:ABC-type polysaccharide/polyol phosphate export permease